MRNGVRAATRRVRRDSLQIRKINNDEQRNYGRTYGDDVLNSEKAERNKQAERRFRAICGGAERVQTEYGDTSGGADLFGALIASLQRLAEDQIRNIHRTRCLTLTCAARCVSDSDFLDGGLAECGALVSNLARCNWVS
jgi:hypothetical protein